MRRRTLALAGLAGLVGVSLYVLIQDAATAVGIVVASSGVSVFWNIVMTAWEKRQGEID